MLKFLKVFNLNAPAHKPRSFRPSASSLIPFKTFSSSQAQQCAAINKNYLNLKKYLQENIDHIAFFSSRAGSNYLSCVLENSLNLGLGTPEFYSKLTARLLRKDIEDPEVIRRLLKGKEKKLSKEKGKFQMLFKIKHLVLEPCL